jgi:hypothetical protein
VRQAAAIRRWQPWRRSTGPKTDAGKARVAINALRHGYRSRAWILRAKRIRRAIRLCAQTLLLVRVLREQERRAALESLQRRETLRCIADRRLAHDRGANDVRGRVEPRYAAHLIEQPIDAIWSFGPRPVSATSFIAS